MNLWRSSSTNWCPPAIDVGSSSCSHLKSGSATVAANFGAPAGGGANITFDWTAVPPIESRTSGNVQLPLQPEVTLWLTLRDYTFCTDSTFYFLLLNSS
ncbi:hypothetical protein M0802_000772 [Mischocyttarus mexicanus]|nr:hypothetical protein M0802_000772 [Mischocyttarus mexicanus]